MTHIGLYVKTYTFLCQPQPLNFCHYFDRFFFPPVEEKEVQFVMKTYFLHYAVNYQDGWYLQMRVQQEREQALFLIVNSTGKSFDNSSSKILHGIP